MNTDDFDDRVTCDQCKFEKTRDASEALHKNQVIKTKRRGHRVALPGDQVSKQGQWMTLTWKERYCVKTEEPAMPKGVKHRCPLTKQEQPVQAEQEWWQ